MTKKIKIVIVLLCLGFIALFLYSKKSSVMSPENRQFAVKQSSSLFQKIFNRNNSSESDDSEDGTNSEPENEGFIYEVDVQSSDECSSLEKFNSQNSTCYYECDDKQECTKIEQEINDELDGWAQQYNGSQNEEQVSQTSDSTTVATYAVSKVEQISLTSGKDTDANRNAWEETAQLSPDALSNIYIESFQIINDLKSDSIAYVSDDDDNGLWNITLNEGSRKALSLQEQKITLIHELGHIIMLNRQQVIPGENCRGLELSEGCATPGSYVQKFVNEFWSGEKLPYTESNYVTEYAESENVEDLAESWAMFVVSKEMDKPVTVADKKIAFFQQFPELVKIRESMRNVLSKEIIRARKIIN